MYPFALSVLPTQHSAPHIGQHNSSPLNDNQKAESWDTQLKAFWLFRVLIKLLKESATLHDMHPAAAQRHKDSRNGVSSIRVPVPFTSRVTVYHLLTRACNGIHPDSIMQLQLCAIRNENPYYQLSTGCRKPRDSIQQPDLMMTASRVISCNY